MTTLFFCFRSTACPTIMANSGKLASTLTREDVITRIGVLAETHLLALKNTVEQEVFEAVADFPVELVSNTVNGYQRFLSDIITPGGDSGHVVAGMILRFRAAMLYEFGRPVLDILQDEVFIKMTDSQFTEAHGTDVTLWNTASPKLDNAVVSSEYDMLSVFLFVSHAKWLIVRVGAALEAEK